MFACIVLSVVYGCCGSESDLRRVWCLWENWRNFCMLEDWDVMLKNLFQVVHLKCFTYTLCFETYLACCPLLSHTGPTCRPGTSSGADRPEPRPRRRYSERTDPERWCWSSGRETSSWRNTHREGHVWKHFCLQIFNFWTLKKKPKSWKLLSSWHWFFLSLN